MPARAGPLLVAGCLRPWAERMVDLARPGPGETCLDVCGDGGAVASLLRRAVGSSGRVLVVDADVAATLAESGPARSRHAAVALPHRLPLRDGCVDVSVSLFGAVHQDDPVATLGEMLRVTRVARGRVVAVGWAGATGAPHEAALDAALTEQLGVTSRFMSSTLNVAIALERMAANGAVALRAQRLRDVVRFDGPEQLWAALVDERPVAAEIATAPAAARLAARDACSARLAVYAAADGTLRIPVEAVVLRSGPGE